MTTAAATMEAAPEDKGNAAETAISDEAKALVERRTRGLVKENTKLAAEFAEFKASIEAERKKAAESKMAADGQIQELLKSREAELATLKANAEIERTQYARNIRKAEAKAAGAVDNAVVLGLVSEWEGIEEKERPEWAEWLQTQRADEKRAALFGALAAPSHVPAPFAARPAGAKTTGSLEERLRSPDPAVSAAARMEVLSRN